MNIDKRKSAAKDETYDTVQFNFVNPLAERVNVDLFNGWTNESFPNTPYGYDPNYNGGAFSFSQANYPKTQTGLIGTSIANPDWTESIPNVGKIYTVNSNTLPVTISVVNETTKVEESIITTTLPAAAGDGQNQILYNNINGLVYSINSGSKSISIIDPNIGQEINMFTTVIGSGSFNKMALDESSNIIYITNAASDLVKFNCNTNTFSLLSGVLPSSCYNINSYSIAGVQYLIVYPTGASNVYIFNTTSDVYSATIAIPVIPNFTTTTRINPSTLIAYYGDNVNNINEFNLNTNTYIGIIAGAFSGSPNELLYVEDYNKLYVWGGGVLYIIDVSTNTIIATSSAVGTPLGMAYSTLTKSIFLSKSGTSLISFNDQQIVPYVSGSTDYNQFIQSLKNDPKKVRQIQLVVDKGFTAQFDYPLTLKFRDANGDQKITPFLPNTRVSSLQFNAELSYIDFVSKPFIMDNQTIISNYFINAITTVKFIISYIEIERADILTGRFISPFRYEDSAMSVEEDINERTLEELEMDNPMNLKPVLISDFILEAKEKLKKHKDEKC